MAPHRTSRAAALGLLITAISAAGVAGVASAVDVPFGAQQVISTLVTTARSVVAADVDGDGDLDVLSASVDDDKVAWYENTDGAGTFGAQQVISTLADGAYDIAVGDVDGDGDVDVLAVSIFDSEVAWYENLGGGSFAVEQVISTATSTPQSVAVADLDGDGDLDALSASGGDNEIAWYENTDGAGTFGSQQLISSGVAANATHVEGADLDGDGDLDVLVCSRNDDTVAWYENTDGAGSFGTEQVISTDGDGVLTAAAADLDGDGDLDVVAGSTFDDEIAWYENTDGAGTFGAQQLITSLADNPQTVTAADLDGDGDLDVLSASSSDDEVAWYENTDGAGTFSTQKIISTLADGATGLATADLDGDGDLDVFSGSQGDHEVAWYENETIHRSAVFTEVVPFAAGQGGGWTTIVEDLDRDGDLDAIATLLNDDTVAWFANDGSGGFGPKQSLTETLDGALGVATGDLDGNGTPDVVASSNGSDELVWYANDGTPGGLGDWTATQIDSLVNGAWGVDVADLDHDGDLDVVVAVLDDNEVSWYANNGSGSFGARQLVGAAGGARAVRVADVDANGDLDVIAAAGDSLLWFSGNGAGGFGAAQTIVNTLTTSSDLRVADMDADGDLDVLGVSFTNDTVAWYENDGTPGGLGDWTANAIPSTIGAPWGLEIADVDQDGDPDVLAISVSGAGLEPYFNDGAGVFTAGAVQPAAISRWVSAADLDGDGDADALVGRQDNSSVGWYENRGGQFALPTENVARQAAAIDGVEEALLRIEAESRGRSGDSNVQVTTLELLFEETEGDPLSSAEANALVDTLRIYLDDGSGGFESGTDTEIFTLGTLALTAGLQSVDVSLDADFSLVTGFGPKTWFVVLDMAANASAQTPNTLRLTHRTSASSTGEDASASIPVTLEFAADESAPVLALSPTADADSDGSNNQAELDNGTDPFDDDTDGDGLTDGDEATEATDPLDPDSDGDGWSDGAEVALGSDPNVGGSVPTGTLSVPFSEPAAAATSFDAVTVEVADVDGDGDLDLLAPRSPSNEIFWFDNVNGDGSSWPSSSIAVDAAQDLAVRDMDRDGDIDLVSSNRFTSTLTLYDNDGAQTFSPTVIENKGFSALGQAVDVGDLDGDGHIDVVVTNAGDATLAWFENDGASPAGLSTRRVVASGLLDVQDVTIADLDGDGDLDLATVSADGSGNGLEGENTIYWFENDGTPLDGGWTQRFVSDSLLDGVSVRSADMDGDGDADLVIGNGKSGQHAAWFENTDGSGSDWDKHVVAVETNFQVLEARPVDVDQDGDLDVVTSRLGSPQVAWYENFDGDGDVWVPGDLSFSTSRGDSVAVGDLDGDGDVDAAVADNDGALRWFRNETIHRSALFPERSLITTSADFAWSVYAADVDGDGDVDALSASAIDDKVAWYENTDGSGTFGAQQVISTAGDGPRAVVAADLDGDADLDALVASELDDTIAWYENTNGAGSFGTQQVISTAADAPQSVFAADVDGDGDLDVLSASSSDDDIAWYENTDGAGSFGVKQIVFGAANGAYSVFAADVDGDGDTDVLSASFNDDTVAWYENTNGAGSFGSQQVISTAAIDCFVFAADVDGDGDVDVLSASRDDDTVAWYENTNGAGSFGPIQVISSLASGTTSVFAADLDGDGDMDALTSARDDNKVAWFENTDGSGSFGSEQVITTLAANVVDIFVADVDGDGRLDALSASTANDAISWYENRGGQFALPTTDVAFQGMLNSQEREVLRIDAANRGRTGDSDAEIVDVELLLEEAPADPLTDLEADALFAELALHLDDGDGMYEGAAMDPEIASITSFAGMTGGERTFTFPDADPDAQLPVGSPKTYFLVVTLEAGAAGASPNTFEITHVTEASSTGEDALYDVPVSLEFEANETTGSIVALAPGSDFDSDGLDNEVEVNIEFTDPGNPDTDGDGLTDGDEVNTHSTDPLDTDTDDDGLDDATEVAFAFMPTVADTDGDGYCDGPLNPGGTCSLGVSDNCPADSNPTQTNSDTLPAGDDCQCGNLDATAGVGPSDLTALREWLVGATPSGPPADSDFCDVNDDAMCSVADAFLLERFVEGASVSIDTTCAAYRGP